jgi:hypothetical protein
LNTSGSPGILVSRFSKNQRATNDANVWRVAVHAILESVFGLADDVDLLTAPCIPGQRDIALAR